MIRKRPSQKSKKKTKAKLPSQAASLQKEIANLKRELEQAKSNHDFHSIASYLAHEIKNYASVIAYFVEVAKTNPTAENQMKALDMAADVSRKLLQLSQNMRENNPDRQVGLEKHAPHQIMEETLKLSQLLLERSQITVIKNLKPVSEISCYENQIQQVFLNLILNAKEAMDGKKRKVLTLESSEDDQYVYIKVSDTGCGMSDEVKVNAFKPFFSTKKKNNSGVGLSISRDIIVKKHLGKLLFSTKANKGTTFTVAFRKGLE